MTDPIIAELANEGRTTRTVLERVPEDRFSWRPHEKSMSLGELAMHIATIPRGIADLLNELEAEVPKVSSVEPSTREELLAALEESVAHARSRVESWGDTGLKERWSMMIDGRPVLTASRIGMVRSLMLNHWYHHRGQLTVYLRLLGVSLPPVYGPTADESPFG